MGTQHAEKVVAEAFWGPVLCVWGVGRCRGVDVSFVGEGAVEDVEGGFVGLVVHVSCVFLQGPVYGFGAEGRGGEGLGEVGWGPGFVEGPLGYGGGEDEGLVGPFGCVFFTGEVGEAGDLVGLGDVAGVGGEVCVSALEGAVEDVGEKIWAGDGSGVFWGNVEIGCSPGAVPLEVFGWCTVLVSFGLNTKI